MIVGVLVFLVTMPSVAGIPPLDRSALIRLEAVVDGRDSLGEGFAALVEHVSMWELPIVDALVVDLQLVMESPAMNRGELFTVMGVVEQQTVLDQPWEGVQEWFVRDDQGVLFALYVVGDIEIATVSTISATAMFYKTMLIEGRDTQVRLYPTFVTPSIAILNTELVSTSLSPLFLLPVLLIASIITFILGRAGRRKKSYGQTQRINYEEVLEAVEESTCSLPEDPANALATMYKQSEDGS